MLAVVIRDGDPEGFYAACSVKTVEKPSIPSNALGKRG